jgi:molybdopterin-guanine dinucleotide biosynthesis protein A
MGQDKGLISYHGVPHREYLYDVLSQFCQRVYLSVNATQKAGVPAYLNCIIDNPAYANTGPIGAVTNFIEQTPPMSLLVVTCDLPYFNTACVQTLLAKRDPAFDATAFFNPDMQAPEPLVTLYETHFLRGVPAQFNAGLNSLRKLLARAKVNLIHQHNGQCIHSADRPEDLAKAKQTLSHK